MTSALPLPLTPITIAQVFIDEIPDTTERESFMGKFLDLLLRVPIGLTGNAVLDWVVAEAKREASANEGEWS